MLPGAEELRAVAVALAWEEYLETCRQAEEYEEAESWAWAKLQQQLDQAAPATTT